MEPILAAVVILQLIVIMFLIKRHHTEKKLLETEYRAERNQLLDRIMANNLAEFKTADQLKSVKRVESSNFLKESMKNQLKAKYPDLEE